MPDYKDNDPMGWCGNPSRGAALGRPTISNGEPEGKMTLRRSYLNSGGYDRNGTYFGCGAPLYWFADEGGNVDGVLRAGHREQAKAKVLQIHPTARFYR